MAITDTDAILISLGSSVLGGLIVASVNHVLTRHRDKRQQFEKLRIEYLIESWKKIEKPACVGDERSEDEIKELYSGLEDAVASINLFGAPREICEAKRFAEALSEGNDPNCVRELLNGLRSSQRDELGLDRVEPMSFFMRMKAKTK